jgi:hypothetical protein
MTFTHAPRRKETSPFYLKAKSENQKTLVQAARGHERLLFKKLLFGDPRVRSMWRDWVTSSQPRLSSWD